MTNFRGKGGPCAFLCCLLLIVGCASKKPIVPGGPEFRIQPLNGGYIVVPPNIPESHPMNASIVLRQAGGSSKVDSPLCTASKGPFNLKPDAAASDDSLISLPPPEDWVEKLEHRANIEEQGPIETLNQFLEALILSQETGCFAAKPRIRDYVMQSIPMRPSENLFNAYGYRIDRGGLDLKPGLRLKIERAYFRRADKGEESTSVGNYLGTSTVSFSVAGDGGGIVNFALINQLQFSPHSIANEVRDGTRDLDLRDLPSNRYRLLFYTYVVPREHGIAAAIVGAQELTRLDSLEEQVRGNGDRGCASIALAQKENCVEFEGFVTLSAQINISINGQLTFVDWGAKVKTVLPMNGPRNLRIERQFMGTYYDVRFDPKNSAVLSLELIGGDRLTWSNR
jgi:hypothetical protein